MFTAFLTSIQRYWYPQELPAAEVLPDPENEAAADDGTDDDGRSGGAEAGHPVRAVVSEPSAATTAVAASSGVAGVAVSTPIAVDATSDPSTLNSPTAAAGPVSPSRRRQREHGGGVDGDGSEDQGTASRQKGKPRTAPKRARLDDGNAEQDPDDNDDVDHNNTEAEEAKMTVEDFQTAFWEEFVEEADPDWTRVKQRDSLYPSSSQYACLKVQAVDQVLDLLEIGCGIDSDPHDCSRDLLVDWGSGIGNVVWQAAVTRGCTVRGLERMSHRHELAEAFGASTSVGTTASGRVRLVLGDARDSRHLDFLTQPDQPGQTIKALANNFQGNWGTEEQGLVLDHVVAGLFASLPPGSILVTLHPLRLGMSRRKAVEHRAAQGLSSIPDPSFFDEEHVDLGTAGSCYSGMQSREAVIAHKYTRVAQPGRADTGGDGSVAAFVCGNPQCHMGRSGIYQPAVTQLPWPHHSQEGPVVGLSECECGYVPRTLRSRRRGRSAPFSP